MNRTHIDTSIKESNGAQLRADVYQDSQGYSVEYKIDGQQVKTETYYDKSIYFVESAVQNWFAGIKTLNG